MVRLDRYTRNPRERDRGYVVEYLRQNTDVGTDGFRGISQQLLATVALLHFDEALGIRAVCLKRISATGRSDMVNESAALY